MWDRRAVLSGSKPHPEPRIIVFTVMLSLGWVIARASNILEARQLFAIAMLQTIVAAVLGWRLYRSLLAPMLYLFFLVPSGEFLVPWLQDFTARFVVFALGVVGVPVYADGTIIEIPAGTFVVAEACAGLRFLIASFAFGVFYAVLVYQSRRRRLAFIGLSLGVPIVANWLRAFGIVYLANVTGNAQAIMADHIIYGWGFFAAITLALIFLGYTFADGNHRAPFSGLGDRITSNKRNAKNSMILATAAMAFGFATVGPIYIAAIENGAKNTVLDDIQQPSVAAPWHSIRYSSLPWKPVIVNANKAFFTAYSDGTRDVLFYMALYNRSGADSNLVRAQNRLADEDHWHIAAMKGAQVFLDDKPERVGVVEFQEGDHQLVVWYFYIVDGRIVPSALEAKYYQIRNSIFGGNRVAAFVAVAVERRAESSPTKVLQDFLSAVGPLPDYVKNIAAERH